MAGSKEAEGLSPIEGAGANEDSQAFYANQRLLNEVVMVGARMPRRLDFKLEELRTAIYTATGLRVSKADLIVFAIENGLPDQPTKELLLRFQR